MYVFQILCLYMDSFLLFCLWCVFLASYIHLLLLLSHVLLLFFLVLLIFQIVYLLHFLLHNMCWIDLNLPPFDFLFLCIPFLLAFHIVFLSRFRLVDIPLLVYYILNFCFCLFFLLFLYILFVFLFLFLYSIFVPTFQFLLEK